MESEPDWICNDCGQCCDALQYDPGHQGACPECWAFRCALIYCDCCGDEVDPEDLESDSEYETSPVTCLECLVKQHVLLGQVYTEECERAQRQCLTCTQEKGCNSVFCSDCENDDLQTLQDFIQHEAVEATVFCSDCQNASRCCPKELCLLCHIRYVQASLHGLELELEQIKCDHPLRLSCSFCRPPKNETAEFQWQLEWLCDSKGPVDPVLYTDQILEEELTDSDDSIGVYDQLGQVKQEEDEDFVFCDNRDELQDYPRPKTSLPQRIMVRSLRGRRVVR